MHGDDTGAASGPAPDELEDELEMEIADVAVGPLTDGYHPLTMTTNRGELRCRYYPAPEAARATIWVGGAGGGFDSPARDLYPRLCPQLVSEGIASLRVQYRHPRDVEECVLDVLAGLGYLENEGVRALALVGHSLGGAVVIQAGTASDSVRGVVTLATQSAGAEVVNELPPQCGILLLHGTADRVLRPQVSEAIYALAHEPRRLILYDGAGHGLDEVADEVERVVHAFVDARLSTPPR